MPPLSRLHRFFAPAILVFATATVAGCGPRNDQPEANEAEAPATNLPTMPMPEPALDRAGLLSAVAQAVSASAAGAELPDSVRSLDGRQFEVRIRFGCRGQAKDLEQAWLGWTFDPEKRTLRVRAKPTISKDEPLVAQIAGDAFESVEGFWIPRPWLLQATCPAAVALAQKQPEQQPDSKSADAAAKPTPGAAQKKAAAPANSQAGTTESDDPEAKGEPVPTAPRIGIAQFFTSEDARTHRRDSRPYSAVKTVPEATPLPPQGFNLVLSGRLRALPGRSVVECFSKGANSPPECVVSVEFLRVWIERPQSRDVIAEWGSG